LEPPFLTESCHQLQEPHDGHHSRAAKTPGTREEKDVGQDGTEIAQCKSKEVELVARRFCFLSDVQEFHLCCKELELEKEEGKDSELSAAAFKRQLAPLKRQSCVSRGGY